MRTGRGSGKPGLRTGAAAAILDVSPNALRAWERRYGSVTTRSEAGHRYYDRQLVLGMRDAMAEGYSGGDVLARAVELRDSGRYRESPVLRERMLRIERRMFALEQAFTALIVELRSRQ